MERIQKIIAHAGICSRRKAEEYIAQGRVKVDGKTITQPGLKVDPEQVIITVDGKPLDGSKTYKINLPKDVPANDFWSFTLYDNQSRGMLQTDQRFPGVDSNKKGLKQNSDGSFDVYFGPKAPEGQENNWIQTDPSKGWNTILRLYGPLDAFYDKTWKPGDPELVN